MYMMTGWCNQISLYRLIKGVTSTVIRKKKKQKKIKIHTDGEVIHTVREQCMERGENSGKRILLRQQIWNQYLKTFYEIEKLDQKQKQIMEFCTSKSLTPPKRKGRFLVIEFLFLQKWSFIYTFKQCN